MFARLLATCCLLNFAVHVGWAVSDGPANSDLVVYLHHDSTQPPRPLEHMKRELSRSMLAAGYHVEWRNSQDPGADTTASTMVVVDLRGSCEFLSGSSPIAPNAADPKELASTSTSGENVLPFSWVNCGNLTRTLAPSLMAEAGARRDYLYGRAMARVVAHELYHILANTREHARDGIAKPCFTVSDLLTERFEFEQSTLAKLQRRPADGPAEGFTLAVAEIPTDR